MTYNVEKLLYVGAGLHLEPVLHFPDVKEFVFIDTLPRSEFDTYNRVSSKQYRNYFIQKLKAKCIDCSLDLIDIDILDDKYVKKQMSCKQKIYYSFYNLPEYIHPTLFTFVNYSTSQTVKYYVSTNFLYNMNNWLKEDIRSADAVIIKDYSPSLNIFSYFDKQKIFIGYSSGYYGVDIDINNYANKYTVKSLRDPNDIIYFLHNGYMGSITFYFKYFCYYNEQAKTIKQFNTFQDFYNHHISALNNRINIH